jgi:hypothetical protein
MLDRGALHRRDLHLPADDEVLRRADEVHRPERDLLII